LFFLKKQVGGYNCFQTGGVENTFMEGKLQARSPRDVSVVNGEVFFNYKGISTHNVSMLWQTVNSSLDGWLSVTFVK
jgi:hypothetical protein